MRQILLVGAALGATAVAMACSGGGGGGGLSAANCGKTQPAGFPLKPVGLVVGSNTAPEMPGTLLDQNGNKTCLRAYTGKVVLINMSAGWCPPCNQEEPGMVSAYNTYASQGYTVLQAMTDGYSQGSPPDANFLQQWTNQYAVKHYLIPDQTQQFWATYHNTADPNCPAGYICWPLNVLVDRDQIVRDYVNGGTDLTSEVQKYVNTPSVLKYQ